MGFGFVYRFTHLTEDSWLPDENWYYVRDSTTCLLANGQIAMTVKDTNDRTQFVVWGEDIEGPSMQLHKDLEIHGDIWDYGP